MARRSVTTWSRLEPRTRDREMRDGLQAAVQDPLWLLGRQWQTGEFVGEDGGSLVDVDLDLTVDRLARFRPGGGDDSHDTVYDYEDGATQPPLETLVERERVRPEAPEESGKNVRLAAEAGTHFLRLVGELDLSAGDFHEDLVLDPTESDGEGEAYTSVVAGRTLDGDEVYDTYDHEDLERFRDAATGDAQDKLVPGDLDPTKPDDPSETDELAVLFEAVTTYREWYRETYEEPEPGESAWRDRRLEYEFDVATGDGDRETVLSAAEYEGGRLDWYDFAVEHDRSILPDGADGPDPVPVSEDMVPTPSRFKGMPAFRWWEIEDDGVDFSAVEAAPEDLSRLLMLEFGLVYGNDWFTLPIDVPVGAMAEVDSLTLETTFNQTISLGSAADTDDDPETDWNMYGFAVSEDDPDRRGLFLPPVIASTIESDTVEEVTFARDEMANVGWAIEKLVEGTVGQRRDRDKETEVAETDTTPVATTEGADAAYQLSTDVPENWFPLLPYRTSLDSIRLERGLLFDGDGAQAPPVGRLLADDVEIEEDELPRSGKTVERAYQRTRWIDGTTHLWSGRSVGVGRDSGDSGLAFDQLVDPRVGEEESSVEDADPYPEGEPIPPESDLAVAAVSPTTPGGPRENLVEEYVVFENAGGAHLDVSGWRVTDDGGHVYEFGEGTTLGPGQRLTLHTGDGENDDRHHYWDQGGQVWNDDGDVVTVLDDADEEVLRYAYPQGPPPIDVGPLGLDEIRPDSPGNDWQNLTEEYVSFTNESEEPVDLSGWRIEDAVGHGYTVPAGTDLAPGESLRLRTGSGDDDPEAGELHWGSGAPLWNNTGDTVTVYDDEDEIVLRESY